MRAFTRHRVNNQAVEINHVHEREHTDNGPLFRAVLSIREIQETQHRYERKKKSVIDNASGPAHRIELTFSCTPHGARTRFHIFPPCAGSIGRGESSRADRNAN